MGKGPTNYFNFLEQHFILCEWKHIGKCKTSVKLHWYSGADPQFPVRGGANIQIYQIF